MEQSQLYRKKSLEQIQSPEQLNDYLRVTDASVWVLLTAVILLLAGLLVWGAYTYIDSMAYGSAEVKDGQMTVRFNDDDAAAELDVGMEVCVGETGYPIVSIGFDENGIFALARVDLPDGCYQATARYKQTQILKLMFR
ncbi:MAG: hypothetical protein IK095_07305 [Oscillospiraceae bacterium]|nr:hypothetical protein [Oscillospiraceae bacterium]